MIFRTIENSFVGRSTDAGTKFEFRSEWGLPHHFCEMVVDAGPADGLGPDCPGSEPINDARTTAARPSLAPLEASNSKR